MRALLDDVALLEHEDRIRVLDGRQAVRDDKARAPVHQVGHGLLDQPLGTGIDGAGRLVQDQDRVVREHRPGDGQQLLLPLRNVVGVLVDLRIVPFGQRLDKVMDVRRLGRLDHLLVRRIRPAVLQVFAHRAGEQPRVLQHHREIVAQFLAGVFLDIPAVHEDPSAVQFVVPEQQLDDGRLAGTSGTDDGDTAAWLRGEREVVDDGMPFFITEGDVVEFNAAFYCGLSRRFGCRALRSVRGFVRFLDHPAGKRPLVFTVECIRLFLFIDDLEDALRCRRRGLQEIGRIGDLLQRLVEVAHVVDERLDVADADAAGDGQIAAQDADQHVSQIADQVGGRHHDAGEELRFPGRFVELVVHRIELRLAFFLFIKHLDHGVAGEHLFNMRVDFAEVFLLVLEMPLRLADDELYHHHRHRQHEQCHDRHDEADADHHSEGAEDGHGRRDDLRDALRQRLVDGLDVVDDAALVFAVGHAVEVLDGQFVHLLGQEPAEFIRDRL